jgi:hypothetical protein
VKAFSFGGNLDQFQEGQDNLKLELLDTLGSSGPAGWISFEDLQKEVSQRISPDKHDEVSIGGVLPSVLAGAAHEGLVVMDQKSNQSLWKLSGKGERQLRKLKR